MFHSFDAWVILLYLAGTTLLGVWLGRGQRDRTDYFLGGRKLPAWALLLSIVATETSTVTFLSVPGKSFSAGGNFFFLQIAVGYILGRLVVVGLLLPLHFTGQPMTAYAILEDRFGVPTRRAASVVFLLARTAGDGLRLFLTALALQEVLSLPFEYAVLIIALVTGIYAVCGGVRSVVWNDCLQFFVYMGGAFIIVAVILARLPGGLTQVVDFAQETDRLRLFDFRLWLPAGETHITFWSGLLGGAFLSLATHGADQLIVQRYLCARNRRAAGWALAWSGPVVLLQFALFLAIGVGLAAYFHEFDPSRLSKSGDQALASFVVNDLQVGLRGVILAAVFAAAMSTLSSSVNSSASSLLDDLAGSWTQKLSDRASLLAARVFTIVFTAAQGGVAIVAYRMATDKLVIDQVLAIAGFAAGLLLGLYFLGLVVGRAASWQAIAALVTGAAVTSLALWQQLNSLWFPVIGSGSTLLAGLLLIGIFGRGRTIDAEPRRTDATSHDSSTSND